MVINRLALNSCKNNPVFEASVRNALTHKGIAYVV